MNTGGAHRAVAFKPASIGLSSLQRRQPSSKEAGGGKTGQANLQTDGPGNQMIGQPVLAAGRDTGSAGDRCGAATRGKGP